MIDIVFSLASLFIVMSPLQEFGDLREGQVEPVRKRSRFFLQQRTDAIQRKVPVGLYFRPVGRYIAIVSPYKHMIKFMFGKPVLEAGMICKTEYFFQWAIEPHFLDQPAVGCGQRVFSRQGVTAAGVCPEAAGVVFVLRALLQQHFTGCVYDEHGKCAVEQAFLVCFQLFHGADRFVLFIYEYNGW